MQNFIIEGKTMKWTVAGADVVGGQLIMVGSVPGVVYNDAEIGADVTLATCGVFNVPKVNGAITQGQKLYYEPVSDKVTTAADDGLGGDYEYVGRAWKAAANLDAAVDVRID
jgi:predicted RecA/RadA family phage recombinase